jgi:nicotinate-nucleotide pyrophosphorylase (carboxylating)
MSFYIDGFIKAALEEDMGIIGDITTDALFSEADISKGVFNFRKEGVLAGIDIAKRVFELLDSRITFEKLKFDGDVIKPGENIAVVEGSTRAILKGERVALNILQRMSGIATNTKKYADKLQGYDSVIADTRKTTPLFRYFEKYAVKTGGGKNHRFGLFDAVMLKDNHIAAAGGIKNAVEKVRKNIPHTTKIEVEVESKEQAVDILNEEFDPGSG